MYLLLHMFYLILFFQHLRSKSGGVISDLQKKVMAMQLVTYMPASKLCSLHFSVLP